MLALLLVTDDHGAFGAAGLDCAMPNGVTKTWPLADRCVDC
jgi:hypothetical protein